MVNELSASTVENIEKINTDIEELSASTVSCIETINEFSASTVSEIERLDANDIVPGTYTLTGDSDSEMVIPTKGEEVEDVKIKVSEDFFDFGTF